MKKNKMMRIASVLLVAVLISTCAISGTFAKYVTKATGTDTARVAKWGIVLSLGADSVFAKEYETSKDHTHGDDYTYEGLAVAAEENVVAPGTSSEEVGDTITGSIGGTPEVAVHYEIKASGIKDVILPAGTYTDYTKLVKKEVAQSDDTTVTPGNRDGEATENTEAATEEPLYGYYDTFTLEEDYTPVVWTLTLGTITVTGKSLTEVLANTDKVIAKLEAAGIENVTVEVDDDTAPTELTVAFDTEPGDEIDLSFELSWEWVFENGDEITETDESGTEVGTGIYEFDAADTFLGNVAAGIEELPEGASITVAATVEVIAVQID